MRGCVRKRCGRRRTTDIRGVLRGPRGPKNHVPRITQWVPHGFGQLQSSLWSNALRVSSLKTHSVKIHHSTLTTTVRYRAKQCSQNSLNLSLIPCYAHYYQEGHVPTIKVNRRHELSLFFTSLNILTFFGFNIITITFIIYKINSITRLQ